MNAQMRLEKYIWHFFYGEYRQNFKWRTTYKVAYPPRNSTFEEDIVVTIFIRGFCSTNPQIIFVEFKLLVENNKSTVHFIKRGFKINSNVSLKEVKMMKVAF